MTAKLRPPESVRAFLERRFANQSRFWLTGGGQWPLDISLGMPTEQELAAASQAVREWTERWQAWTGAGTVTWQERRFGRLGTQRFPAMLRLESADDVARWIGQELRWQQATRRVRYLIRRFPSLACSTPSSGAEFAALADYAEPDFQILCQLLVWLESNPNSQLYLRQIPVAGLDTKWIEPRIRVVRSLLMAIAPARAAGIAGAAGVSGVGRAAAAGFHELLGLRTLPYRVRVRLLCPDLRARVGGLGDIECPLQELAALPIQPRTVLIFENQDTGLAIPDIPATAVIVKLGNAVGRLREIPWLQTARILYSGDIDTHGFAILNRAREILPHLQSLLMDEGTLLAHRELWGREGEQCPDISLDRLTPDEQRFYQDLRRHRWGLNVRLEQERIPFERLMLAVSRT